MILSSKLLLRRLKGKINTRVLLTESTDTKNTELLEEKLHSIPEREGFILLHLLIAVIYDPCFKVAVVFQSEVSYEIYAYHKESDKF